MDHWIRQGLITNLAEMPVNARAYTSAGNVSPGIATIKAEVCPYVILYVAFL